mmetsp:Transcript_36317/g.88361  ORF Transcript_36317/g.88361 Transcript_36317/m.88361 type:complete len:254 (-) Transcript_36317:259-1020(-)
MSVGAVYGPITRSWSMRWKAAASYKLAEHSPTTSSGARCKKSACSTAVSSVPGGAELTRPYSAACSSASNSCQSAAASSPAGDCPCTAASNLRCSAPSASRRATERKSRKRSCLARRCMRSASVHARLMYSLPMRKPGSALASHMIILAASRYTMPESSMAFIVSPRPYCGTHAQSSQSHACSLEAIVSSRSAGSFCARPAASSVAENLLFHPSSVPGLRNGHRQLTTAVSFLTVAMSSVNGASTKSDASRKS